MKTAAFALALAGSAAAQDAVFSIQETTDAGRYVVYAEFLGALPSGATRLDVVWGDVALEISGDAPITFDAWNPGYENFLSGSVVQADVAANPARFEASMFGTPTFDMFGGPAPDSSNPLLVATFMYAGSTAALRAQLDGQNAVLFEGPGFPFGIVELYQTAQGTAGTRSFTFQIPFGQFPADQLDFFVPAPGAFAVAPLAFVAARRQRK